MTNTDNTTQELITCHKKATGQLEFAKVVRTENGKATTLVRVHLMIDGTYHGKRREDREYQVFADESAAGAWMTGQTMALALATL